MPLKKNPKDFTIGADPEFLIFDENNEIIAADKWGNEEDNFGADAGDINFEVRPTPSYSPLEVVNNIHEIFLQQIFKESKFANVYSWKAGSYFSPHRSFYDNGYPLGGHIHFGTKGIIAGRDSTKILSQYVGACSILIEDRKEGQKRRAGEEEYYCYGQPNNFRTQNYGFEYRTPSSWITSPYVAAAILCLAKTVLFEVINNTSFKPGNYANKEDFKEMNTTKVKLHFPKLWDDVKKMALYPIYKQYLEFIPFLVDNNRNWFPKCGMKAAWGVIDVNALPKQNITLDSIWGHYKENSNKPC